MSDMTAPALPREATLAFEDPAMAEHLASLPAAAIDVLPYGVIGFDRHGEVTLYNAREAAAAGLSATSVLGRHMFEEIGPCMNTDLVAGRFEAEEELDVCIPFVLTLRMRPTPVTLRLIKRAGDPRRWLLLRRIQRAAAA